MTDELTLTELRRTALEQARDRQVTYDNNRALWLVDGEPAAGWAGRTFAELHRGDYIARGPAASGSSTVDITDLGSALLSS